MFVVLATNTNHDNTVYGPFNKETDALAAKFNMDGRDHLHSYQVHEVNSLPADDEEE